MHLPETVTINFRTFMIHLFYGTIIVCFDIQVTSGMLV